MTEPQRAEVAGGKPRVTLSGSMPPDALNGLLHHHADLLANPQRLRVVVTLMDVQGDGANYDRGERWPICRSRQIEVITDPGDAKTVAEVLARAMADRTGSSQLDLGLGLVPGQDAPPPATGKSPGEPKAPRSKGHLRDASKERT